MRYFFDASSALLAISVGTAIASGNEQERQAKENAAAEAARIEAQVGNEQLSAKRQLSDLDRDTEQNIALLKARVVASGGNLSDVSFASAQGRVVRELAIASERIRSDTAASTRSLLTLGRSVTREGQNQGNAAQARATNSAVSSELTFSGR